MTAQAFRRRPFFAAERPLAFAHRGGAALWPENTLAAFRGALELGYIYLETDVHMTRDGVLVVCHDERLERTTDGRGFIRHHTLEKLRTFDAGYWYTRDGATYPFRSRGLTVPTLAEVFALSPDLRLNVEMKQPLPSVVEPLWRFIEEHELHDRILVAAARDPLVRAFRRLSSGRVATAAGQHEALTFWLASMARAARWLPVPFDALQVPVQARGLAVIDRRLLRAAHRHGIQVHAWTINEPGEMRRLLELGVDGIMTDQPDRLRQVIGELRAEGRLR